MDEKKFKRKYLFGIFSSPLTLFPVIAGITGFFGGIIFGSVSMALVSLIIGFLIGGGIFFQRLLLGCEGIALKAREELEQESYNGMESLLDELDKGLVQDRDSRTQAALRDLRALVKLFRGNGSWKKNLDAQSSFDISNLVGNIFNECVASLKVTLELYEASKHISNQEASNAILEKRDEKVLLVQDSVKKLSLTYGEVQELGVIKNPDKKLVELRQELDNQLDVARKVDEELSSLDCSGVDEETLKEFEKYAED